MSEPMSESYYGLERLCRKSPEWAAARIRHMSTQRAKDREAFEAIDAVLYDLDVARAIARERLEAEP